MGATHSNVDYKDTVNFFLNGKAYTVSNADKIGPQDVLVDYIRENAGLTGTKYMCREGGCGACVVSVKVKDPVTGEETIKAVNSCLIPTFSCDGWDISTIESMGNRREDYSQIQKRLVQFGGTQCGFCTSGMVMNMHSLMKSSGGLTVKEIEDNFDGNICRCTGYRSILDAFKTFAGDASPELMKKCADIEECGSCPVMKVKPENCIENENSFCINSSIFLNLQTGEKWVKATTLDALFNSIQEFQTAGLKYRIVAGNTGTGVYKHDGPYQAFVDITSIPDLQTTNQTSESLIIGGCVTLAKFIKTMKQASSIVGFSYAGRISKHVQRVANVPVRNAGTIAGNLMLKHAHHAFPSDIFLTLETVNAELVIASSLTEKTTVSVAEFLQIDMKDKIIVSVNLKSYSEGYSYRSFKVSRRYQNAHAYVNAGFMMKIDKSKRYTVLETPSIVYGGINPTFIHATETESILVGKSLLDDETLKSAFNALSNEIVPNDNPPDASPEYRKALTQSLLYRYILGVIGPDAKQEFKTGGKNIKRDTKTGTQNYDMDKEFFPVHQPIRKIESVVQCTGEAQYINDIYPQKGELFGAFVTSTIAKAKIQSIDASAALNMKGVVTFIQARDIPGKNNYMVFFDQSEEIFAANEIKYAGQPVGMIVAENKSIAFQAVKLVKVNYSNVQTPLLTIEDVIESAKSEGREDTLLTTVHKSVDRGDLTKATQKVIGEFKLGSQYHFQMETHICICVPKEDGMDVYSATQWMDHIQAAIASSLGIPNNEVNINVRRLGGAYGSKITRGGQTATACAVAAYVTNRPVRVALDLQTNMESVGKRPPYFIKYEADVDDNGKIYSLKGQMYCDPGMASNEETAEVTMSFFQSMYAAIGWDISTGNVITNTPANTWCRAPGTTPGIAMIENIMEHIAFAVKKDPTQVRLINMLTQGQKIMKPFGNANTFESENLIPRMLEELERTGNVQRRRNFIKNFNLKSNNRWKKRGMALVPMRYPLEYGTGHYPVYIAIYKNDATVVVSHGGIESGQGLNTKVAQTVAYAFDIPMSMIAVKPSNNLVAPNTDSTGGSITSELCCYGALVACNKLKERMKPFKDAMKKYSWFQLIQICYKSNIDLTASHMPSPLDGVKTYDIWVVNLSEVEIDCLTGEYRVVRVDIIEDAGKSLNPEIDVGQVEGALIMGLGLWTTEKLVYDKTSGRLLTNGTWEYKPPLPKDIPDDLRVTLLKNAPNPYGVLRSKATGEPPLCSSVSVLFAIKNAIYAARQDAGHNEWFQLDASVTPEDIRLLCLSDPSQFRV